MNILHPLSFKHKLLLISIVVLLVNPSCKRFDEVSDTSGLETEWIRFSTGGGIVANGSIETKALENEITCDITDWEYSDEEETKASITENLSGEAGVFGYNFTSWASSLKPTVMCNTKSSFDGDILTPEVNVLWKNQTKDSVRFYAYAPYDAGTVSTAETGGVPYLAFTASTDNSKQQDILYACSGNIHKGNRSSVPLQFSHALCAVQFRLGIDNATLKKVEVSNIYTSGTLSLGGGWSSLSGSETYSVSHQDSILLMIPQTLQSGATVTLTYNDGSDHTISASIAGTEWAAGKKVVYTLKKKVDGVEYIYFDLYCGDIVINESTYSGYICVNGADSLITGEHKPTNKYYIYQSASSTYKGSNESIKYKNTGYATVADFHNRANIKPRLPQYSEVSVNGKKWAEYITNNTNPAEVLATWCSNEENITTVDRILITGNSSFDVTLDRIYSRYFPYLRSDTLKNETYESIYAVGESHDKYGGLTIGAPNLNSYDKTWSRTYEEKVTLRLKGNNYFSRISYSKPSDSSAGGYLKITSEKGDGISEGTLTVTFPQKRKKYDGGKYYNFSRCSLIGGGNPGDGDNSHRQVKDLYFNGGVIYVGLEEILKSNWSQNKNLMTCIGAVNSTTEVTINGGVLTSVAYGPGPAIGGGAGWSNYGGPGIITINGGTVYAWCFGVAKGSTAVVKGTAIGGGGSGTVEGSKGTVTINGGNVYAYSIGGAAVGGGSSGVKEGGDAQITINGGHLYAKSLGGTIGSFTVSPGTAIGGGNAGSTSGDGGNANMTINGGVIIAGSVGGGSCANSSGKIGSADIKIKGGETTAQFIMAAGAAIAPEFTMTGGTVKNSSTSDTEYVKVKENGGAVYMESGTCEIKGGTIKGCSASLGGAIYMNGGTFTHSGGKISGCNATTSGGGVYIEGGDANVTGGEIYHNLASKGNGGGVYVTGGNFTMTGGKVNNNAADADPDTYKEGNGGGIYVASETSDPQVKLLGGEMMYNAADRNGGGLCVDMEGSTHNATIIIGREAVSERNVTNPDIELNSAALSGGGMAVQGSGSNITIYSGTVKGNVSAYVKNEDIRNDGGIVTLVGKNEEDKAPQVDVQYNTITFYANNGEDPESYTEQRVITSTNSLLDPTSAGALSFEKEFYHIASWNTRRDGTGTSYKTAGGETMNITVDVVLYAQWVKNQ